MKRFKEFKNSIFDEDTIKIARDMGTDAFLKGKVSVPALDKDFSKFMFKEIKGKPFGAANELLTAWTTAWHAENLK